jgi:prolyl oligopeptidase
LKGDDYYYYSFNSGLQAQAILYRIHKSQLPASIRETEEGPCGELFFDPNRLSTDGTASLASTSFSESGKYLAYGVSRSGSDWTTIYVRKTDSPHKVISAEDTRKEAEDDGRMSDIVRMPSLPPSHGHMMTRASSIRGARIERCARAFS